MAETTHEEYQQNLKQIMLIARLIRDIPIPKFLQAIDRAESIGPIIDPTLWINNSGAMSEDKEMLQAAKPLWEWAQKVAASVEATV